MDAEVLGTTVGNFRLVKRLGAGGMGAVYLAEHAVQPEIRAAVKLLLPHISAHQEHVQRFFNEALVVSRIQHSGIVKISDLGFLPGGQAYLVMELLEGHSLAQRLQQYRGLPLAMAFELGRQAASVLEAVHAAGFTHRDLKPDNIFVIADREMPGGERVKILDFGIAKLGESSIAGHAPRTMAGGAMGTPAYMAPEQWLDSSTVDARSDMYALGCVLFEMACGRLPFVGRTLPEFCNLHLNTAPPPPRSFNRAVPGDFERLVLQLLAKRPEERPVSMVEVERQLERLARDQAAPRGTVRDQRLEQAMGPTVAPAEGGSFPPTRLPVPSPLEAAVSQPALVNTTLGAAAGQAQLVQRAPVARGSRRLVYAGGGAAGVAVVALAAVLASGDKKDDEAKAANPTREAAPPVSPAEAAAALPVAEPIERNRWVRVQAARGVRLGISSGQVKNEETGFHPGRKVLAPEQPFEIQQHEVTWGELDAAFPELPFTPPAWVPADKAKRERLPATGVPWGVAADHCKRLGGRLPSEAEWELAGRGPRLRRSPDGGSLERALAFAGPDGRPVAVMQNQQDRAGDGDDAIFDLAGNAQEWTADPWTPDDTGKSPAWAVGEGRTYVAIRGLPLREPPPEQWPAVELAYREAMCAEGACPDDGKLRLEVIGFRCVR